MLKGIDHRLNADVLGTLRAMGPATEKGWLGRPPSCGG